jgi:two-component sensor histidine kinase
MKMPRTRESNQAAEDLRNRATALAAALELAEQQNDKYRAAFTEILYTAEGYEEMLIIARKALGIE